MYQSFWPRNAFLLPRVPHSTIWTVCGTGWTLHSGQPSRKCSDIDQPTVAGNNYVVVFQTHGSWRHSNSCPISRLFGSSSCR
jgi:hypothetical protein